MSVQVFQPFEIFYDINGRPLDDGFIWVGQPNLDPETNQVSVFFDEALTIPATQPVRTRNGFPSNTGVQAQIFVSETTFSITIKNKNSTLIRSVAAAHSSSDLEGRLRDPNSALNGANIPAYGRTDTVAVDRTVQAKLDERLSARDKGVSDPDAEALRVAMANADWSNPSIYGPLKQVNGTASTVGIVDAANFAGQTLGSSAPIGNVFHHYTDGHLMQLDNVGSGNTMILKLAHNPVRRADKPADFVGDGNYLQLQWHDFAAGFAKSLFFISNIAEFVWTGVKGIATLWQNKAEDGVYAFQFKTTNAHAFMLRFLNGANNVFSFENDVAFTRAKLASHANQTAGMYLVANAGDLRLDAAGDIRVLKTVRANSGNLVLGITTTNALVESQVPFKPRNYAVVGDLPPAASSTGAIAMLANIPIYSQGVEWRYIRDDAPV